MWYIICGRGPLVESYKQLAADLGVSDRLIMTGYRNDVYKFYRTSDLFVFPSFREGLPVSVMETMSAGLPILCSQIRGNRDLVIEGENGFFIDCTDYKQLVSVANSLLSNTEEMEKLCINNISRAKDYDISAISSTAFSKLDP